MALSLALERAQQLATFVAVEVSGKSMGTEERTTVAGTLCSVCLDHHESIIILISQHHPSSAAALMRPMFEAYGRGIWLAYVASDREFRRFLADRNDVTFRTMIASIERLPEFSAGTLGRFRASSWGALCDFAHGGTRMITRNFNGSTIEPNFPEDVLEEMLSAAGATALLAAVAIAELVDDEQMAQRLLARIKVARPGL